MNERQERFIDLLRQIFELDKADLDFGIYRILNIRRREIEEFFTTRLPQKITETLQPFAACNKDTIRQRMNEIESQLGNQIEILPDSIPMVTEYKQLKLKLQQGTDLSALESDVYSALYSFFSRYYDEGDFISKRRYKEGVYAIPYEGEEVKLYWANQDQYYIKTSENFKDYTFVADGYNIHFRLVDATTEQNNNKETGDKKRKFMLFTENEEQLPGVQTFEVEGKDVSIRFLYDVPEDPKVKYEETNLAAINAWITSQPDMDLRVALLRISNPDAKADKRKTIIQKHLEAYVAKNSFDYFIHKDLGGFLSRELDFFIKNEVMHLDDLDTESEARVGSYLAKVRAIKRVGKDIITFLAQLENFQKRLWMKKKFVVETNWCVTLDRVPEKYYDEICHCEKQVNEWVKLYAIDMDKGDLVRPPFSIPLKVDYLRANQLLVLDTANFTDDFKLRLMSDIDELDKKTIGVLAFSENLQALNLLYNRFKESVRGCYIDPPFNLGENADYLYKVDYKDSTWLSLLQDRVMAIKKLLMNDGSIFVRCSHDGNMILRQLMNETYGKNNYRNEIILRRAEETKGDLNKQFETIKSITVNYDNLYWYSKQPSARFSRIIKPISQDKSDAHWHSFWKAMDRPTMRYCLLGIDLTDHYGQWMWEKNRAQNAVDNYIKFTQEFEPKGISLEEYWESTGKKLEFVKRDGDKIGSIKYWIPPRTETMADTNWLDIKGYANKWGFKTENSEGVLKRVIESLSETNEYILDCFLGSGTTAAVSIKTNRKFIGVDMGEQFYSVALPRLKYVLNGEWSGVSSSCNYKGGGLFKYVSLESYEDALSNLSLKPESNMQTLFGDEYTLQYMLDIESRDSLLNVKAFTTPFNYEMRITEKNETKVRKVDVCETFNYLIGLTVIRQGAIQRYQTTEARHLEYEGAVDLVIDREGAYQFRQIEGTLRDGRRVLVIWRNITDDLLASNAALDAYFTKYRINPQNRDYDIIYVNGDSNIENLRTDEEHWKVVRTETEFNKRMFEDC